MDVNQRAFDDAAKHLLVQGEPCEIQEGRSSYRGPRGLKCGIGALISDQHYEHGLEDQRATNAQVYEAVCRSGYEGVNPQLLVRLQQVHDNELVRSWRTSLRDVAEGFGLNSAVLA